MRSGNFKVPLPGCHLQSMISIQGKDSVMKITSAGDREVAVIERAAGCTPELNDDGACRLFKVTDEGELHISYIQLKGGHVLNDNTCLLEPYDGWPNDCAGGLVFLHTSSLLHAKWSVIGTGITADLSARPSASIGGAIIARHKATIIIEDSQIVGNCAFQEGGAIALYGANALVVRSEIIGNVVKNGIYNDAGSSRGPGGGGVAVVDDSSFKAVHSNISYNSAHTAEQGAGINLRYGTAEAVLANCTMGKNYDESGTDSDIRFTVLGNRNEIKKGSLLLLNMPSEGIDIGGGSPVHSCEGAGKRYCANLLGFAGCAESGEADKSNARLVCSGDCASSWYKSHDAMICDACPRGRSNNGIGLTHMSQCLGSVVSLSATPISKDSLKIQMSSQDNMNYNYKLSALVSRPGAPVGQVQSFLLPNIAAIQWTGFQINERYFLAAAIYEDDIVRTSNPDTKFDQYSIIFEYNRSANGGGQFKEIQRIATHGGNQFAFASIDNRNFLAICNYKDGSDSYDIDSIIYEYDINAQSSPFKVFVKIRTNACAHMEFYTKGNELFLIVANHYDKPAGKTKIDSIIYKIDLSSNSSLEYLKIQTNAVQKVKHAMYEGETFILVSNYYGNAEAYQVLSHGTLSVKLIKKFSECAESLDFEPLIVKGRLFVVTACRTSDSIIYEYKNDTTLENRFQQFQIIVSGEEKSWKSFSFGNMYFLSSCAYSESGKDSIIYISRNVIYKI